MERYLRFLQSSCNSEQIPRLLVSGSDQKIAQTAAAHVISTCAAKKKILFIIDSLNSGERLRTYLKESGFDILDPLDGGVTLCDNLLKMDSMKDVSRLCSLLKALGFTNKEAMKIVDYLQFVSETEKRLGHSESMTPKVLQEYSGTILVSHKLETLSRTGRISKDTFQYLLGRYEEISSAAADFELFLNYFQMFLHGPCPFPGAAVYFSTGSFSSDEIMQDLMCHMTAHYANAHVQKCVTLIFDRGQGNRISLIEMLQQLSPFSEVHMISKDAFFVNDEQLSVLMNTFPVRIYSRHESMASCEKIQDLCGQYEVPEVSHSVSKDRRIRNNSPWDILMGTNRTETNTRTLVKKYRYPKEQICQLPLGTGIIDCCGRKTICTF